MAFSGDWFSEMLWADFGPLEAFKTSAGESMSGKIFTVSVFVALLIIFYS